VDSSLFSFLFSGSIHTELGIRVLVASVELAFLATILGGVCSVFRIRGPRFLSCLWAVVLIKPLVTLAVGSPLVLVRFEIAPEVIESRGPPRDPSASPQQSEIQILPRQESGPTTTAGRKPARPSSQPKRAWYSIPLTRGWMLAAITFCWAGGICIGGLRWVLGGYRLGCMVARAGAPDARLRGIYEDEARRRGVPSPPDLSVSPEVESPVIFGAFRPIVLLPAWLVEGKEGKLRHLFSHELAHHRHRDALVLAVGQLSLVLFFFNPFAHWAYRQWLCNAELACDRSLIESEEEAREYARELFSVLEGMRMRQAALSGLYATRHQIGTRVNALLENPMLVPSCLGCWGRCFVVFFALALFLFGFGMTEDWGDDPLCIGTFEKASPSVETTGPVGISERSPNP